MIELQRPTLVVGILALLGCGRGARGDGGAPTSSASAAMGGTSKPSAQPAASSGAPATSPLAPAGSAVPLEPPSPAPLTAAWVGAKGEKACKAQTIELAGYQQRGEVSLGGHGQGVAAAWRARIGGKPQDQVAFASFDPEGRKVASPRGVGLTMAEQSPRVFASGLQWTVVWFDEKGLAFARPRNETLPPPDVGHLNHVGPDAVADVALASTPSGGVLAATPFGPQKAQLGLFLFASEDNVASKKSLGVTHHGKQPHRPAVAAGPSSTFVVWDEGGALVGSRFDSAGKENEAPCTLAPASGEKRERVAVAATGAGATVMWMEGTHVRTRALDASGCPASPIWTAAEGRWATLASLGDSALVAWVADDGRLLAARLQPSGAPPERGLDASEGTGGVKDAPAVVAFGAGKVAFGWSEPMSAVIKTKRLAMRIVEASCVP